MIEITNLSKKYKNAERFAVEDLSFTVNAGEIFGFVGPNGAGKSTAIKCMTGILPFEHGNIKIAGFDMAENPVEAKRNFGYVSDNHLTYESLTGKEYVNLMASLYGVSQKEKEEREEKLVNDFELTDAYNSKISSYSHGMKQKICIIAVLIHNPKVWILDEPLTGLDPKGAFTLKKLMREHADAGNCVFFSSHMLDIVEKICDRLAIVNKGKILSIGDFDEIKSKCADLSLEDYFLSVTDNSNNDVDFDSGVEVKHE